MSLPLMPKATAVWLVENTSLSFDQIGEFCGLHALDFPACTKLLGPIVPGTVVPHGAKVPGTSFQLDPVKAAFDLGAMIRWLDFNDTWLAAEWGHPSDNLGGILMTADWVSRNAVAAGKLSSTAEASLLAAAKTKLEALMAEPGTQLLADAQKALNCVPAHPGKHTGPTTSPAP